MKSCPHEAEVQAILRRGHWPEACDPEFRNHLETCHTCGEQLLVLHAFHAARAHAMQTAPMNHPNLIWWRAQLRRRNDLEANALLLTRLTGMRIGETADLAADCLRHLGGRSMGVARAGR